ncbi:glycosyltransferase [Nocardia sp. NRRL S-836]|uniref:glycosyltransferase n=1 Tax=Nocardia sp. NRRL S-836 TaxID=1519492 RepID=UPI0006B0453C|nr:glycosyltransferase [Nocardia sp. NRRL S-836]
MKIAMVSLQANPLTALRDGDAVGPRLHVAKLAEALHRQGHELTVYTRQTDERLPCRMRLDDGFAVVHLPAGPPRRLEQDDVVPHLGEFARHLQACWTDDVPDVIHAHQWTSGLAAVLSARQDALPVVQSFHDPVGGDAAGAERLVGRAAAAVVATSGHDADELVKLGVRRPVVSTVPWGVDTELFTPTGPAAARGAMSRVLTVSNLGQSAGVDDLISALPGVLWTELVVAGGRDGAEVDRLRAVAADHGVADRVTFLGHVPHSELPPLYRSADVVACPQRHEPFGVVPLEAMACGVPVVASAVGGLAESVVHAATGLLVPPREPAVLARALRSLLRDDVRRQELGFAAQDRARVRYAWDRVALEVASVYQRVLPSPPVPRRPVVLDRREEGAGV